MNKIIVFDIDGTWSLDPDCFVSAANIFRSFGWRVIILTGAVQPFEKLIRLRINSLFEYYCSNGQAKQEYVKNTLNIKECVFVDNDPNSLISRLKDDLE